MYVFHLAWKPEQKLFHNPHILLHENQNKNYFTIHTSCDSLQLFSYKNLDMLWSNGSLIMANKNEDFDKFFKKKLNKRSIPVSYIVPEKVTKIKYESRAQAVQTIFNLTQCITWRRWRSRQCSIVCAWGDGSKHGNSALAENDILWETPTTTPAFGRSPKGYTSRSNSSSGSN